VRWGVCRDPFLNPQRLHIGSHHEQGLTAMKVRDIIKLIEADGWYRVSAKSGHRQYKYPTKPGRVTIAGQPSHDLTPGTLNSILEQAQLKKSKD
jgi:predicted RNA binding protein YcfA (HicA-like mRNA interferase family)